LDEAEELALVSNLDAEPFATILVVSDLHLGVGIDDKTSRYVRLENFISDGAFSRFLRAQQATLPGPQLLVLNGDILDFLRIAIAPTDAQLPAWAERLNRFGDSRTAEDLKATIEKNEIEYGLQTDDFKSLWKLDVMATGHPLFFSALATWLRNGGTVAYTRGNHDPEQYWPLIRRAFRDIVSGFGVNVATVEQRIAFVDDAFCVRNVLFQHGHLYEKLTRTANPPIRPGATQLELPLGSLVNRYVINKLERISPFLDNMKPVQDAVLALIKEHPLVTLTLVRRSSRLLARAVQRRRGNSFLLAASLLGLAISNLIPVLVAGVVLVYLTSPTARLWLNSWLSNPWLRTGLAVLGVLLPVLLRKVIELLSRRRQYREGEDDFAGGALAELRRRFAKPVPWPTVYAVLGHTHAEDVQSLPPLPGAERTLYLNTGTWIPRWPKDRPDLIGRVLLTFVRFTRYDNAYVHEILRWDDSGGVAREATILAPR
jgi:UDP-2,3-diacylglucosamine pyrophosphatase LpxH